ncbi:MAG: hypothetical protein IKQ53_06755 [Bacteroidales bacterium]|nr:hypothetical protein [Bacteroidales bacterium]
MNWKQYQDGMYDYYCRHTEDPIPKEDFLQEVAKYKEEIYKYVVYFGYSKKKNNDKVQYVGTTIQHPMSRWYYHSTHGKDLRFEVVLRFNNKEDMLEKEYEFIKKLHPPLNKITKRQQNLNVPLTGEELEKRKGDPEWCQCCLKRRVNKGYKYCYFCSKI